MRKTNSVDRTLTEAEIDVVAGGSTRGFFNEVIAKGMAIENAKHAGILASDPLKDINH